MAIRDNGDGTYTTDREGVIKILLEREKKTNENRNPIFDAIDVKSTFTAGLTENHCLLFPVALGQNLNPKFHLLSGPLFRLIISDLELKNLNISSLKNFNNLINNFSASELLVKDAEDHMKFKKCKKCKSKDRKLYKCGRCGEDYCSKECQTSDYTEHKEHCVCINRVYSFL